jgi:hypothetical protein
MSIKAELFHDIEFPIAPDFEAMLPSANLEEVYRACEKMLATALAAPGELERRQSAGITAEFIM